MIEILSFLQAPTVEDIGSNHVTVKFLAWGGPSGSDTFHIPAYKIDYTSNDQVWTTYSTVESVDGQDLYEVPVTGLQVCQVQY